MKSLRFLSIITIAVALILTSGSATRSQEGDCRYFEETRHHVCNEFLDFFETRGGLEIFGYPLTRAFEDPDHGGLRVQYFQRARMEWHPHNPNPYKVQLGLLVDELGYDFPPAQQSQIPSSNSAIHHYFPETQHVVSYAFLEYFRNKGGLDIFGYPRSEFMFEDGHLVQYFQRARMEWHPENPAGSQMKLTNLGEIYLERIGIPGNYDQPEPPRRPETSPQATAEPSQQGPVTELSVNASVQYAITGREGTQTIYVYVNNQAQQPISGANVRAVVNYPSGDQAYTFESTDASGFTKRSFEILQSPPGKRVVIDVTVTYGDIRTTTQTFFLPWW